MARPSGYMVNRYAIDDVLRLTGLSLTEVAQLVGVTRQHLSGLRLGDHAASITVARKIAQAVGVHPATLFPTIAVPADDEPVTEPAKVA